MLPLAFRAQVPQDLDTKPYRDEHDDDLSRRMLACVDKGQIPKGFRRRQLLKDAASTIADTSVGMDQETKTPQTTRKPANARRDNRKPASQ